MVVMAARSQRRASEPIRACRLALLSSRELEEPVGRGFIRRAGRDPIPGTPVAFRLTGELPAPLTNIVGPPPGRRSANLPNHADREKSAPGSAFEQEMQLAKDIFSLIAIADVGREVGSRWTRNGDQVFPRPRMLSRMRKWRLNI